jgi:hypothetical protein
VTPAARRRASEVDSAVAELDSLAKQGLREKEAGTDLDPCQQLRDGRRRRRPRKSRSAVGSAGGSGLADGRRGLSGASLARGWIFFACAVCIAAVGDQIFCFASAATVRVAK